jgi:hypothetical protein
MTVLSLMFHRVEMQEHTKIKISVISKSLTTARSGLQPLLRLSFECCWVEFDSVRKAYIVEILVFILKVMTYRFHGGGLI